MYVSVSKDQEMLDYHAKEMGLRSAFPMSSTASGSTYIRGRDVLIWLSPKSADKIACHESIHAANYILEFIGFQFTYENDEPQAYLASFIHSWIQHNLTEL